MKIGRNDLCPCGSGQKYKRCCLLKQQETAYKDNVTDNVTVTDTDNDSGLFEAGELSNLLTNLHSFLLRSKPHIKKYKRIRKLHGEIVDSMIDYFQKGNFEQKVDVDYASQFIPEDKSSVRTKNDSFALLKCDFDLETREGAQGFYDMLIYKAAPNISCITEEYIRKNRYRKLEKVEFLQSMLESESGLFEITKVDMGEGYAYLKEVFTDYEFKITDIALSSNINCDEFYVYTRIITYQNVSFGTGLNLLFSKTDPDIENFIKLQKENYSPLGEFSRFIELYNLFSKDNKGIKVITHSY